MADDKDDTQMEDSTRPDKSGGDPLGIVGWEIGGKYIISAYIGGGGFGEVYQGYNKNLPDQRLVFKFFKRVQAREKFDKEARILCLLDHPNISRVIDYLPDEGAVVVSYIDGKNGSQVLKESGALDEAMFLKLARALTSAVAYAHKKNIAHRDLKPGNVMFDKNDHIYLIDFGIAKEIGSQATKTAYQALTPMFAAPERQDGESDYDPFLSDIFETGVTLFNFATDDLPYRNPAKPDFNDWGGSSAEKLTPEMKRILMKATHPVPQLRYQKADEFADEIKSLKRAYGGEARPKKGKAGVKLTVAFIILIIIAAGVYFGRNQIMEYYQQLTAKEQAATEPEEPELKSVIDSIISSSETTDSAELSASEAVAIKTVEKPGDETALEFEVEKKEVPAEKTPEVAAKEKAKEEPPVTITRHALSIKIIPGDITLLSVAGHEASKDSTFMLQYGNHPVVVYHPEYPIYRKTVYMSKMARTIEINLEDEFEATAWANLQLSLSPPSDEHAIDLNFNGKGHTLLEFPVLDLKKRKGSWLLEAAIYDVSVEGKKPRIDSLVTFPYGGGEHSVVKGNRGEINLGSKNWNDETVPFLIFWSED